MRDQLLDGLGFDGKRWGELAFGAHGRHFSVFIGVGRHASRPEMTLLRRSLKQR